MKKDVICLFELNGLSAAPWAEAGHRVYCYDKATPEERTEGNTTFCPWDADEEGAWDYIVNRHVAKGVALVLSFPPCDDMATSGASHFASKLAKDPECQDRAVMRAGRSALLASRLGAPYAVENPVSVLSTKWRKPDHIFNPYEYGGYLPEDDVHPLYPEYIAARDAYPKKTCYWTGGGFVMPPKKPVYCPPGYSTQHRKLGGKSAKTKRIRSMSPRGIARAIYEANK